MPAAVLAERLGDRSRHPGVLRHRALGPRAEGRSPTTPTSGGSCSTCSGGCKAPLQTTDGTLVARDRGTPQGSAISPLLANLFLHYAFDAWMVREFPAVQFERYCDDAVVHCAAKRQARQVRDAIAARLAQVGLELHPDKTRIVYCKDADRRGSHEHDRFTFLGYTFRPATGQEQARQALRVRSCPRSARDARRRWAGRSGPGSCTGAVTSPSMTLHACSTPSCRGGSTTTDASTVRVALLPPAPQRAPGAMGHAEIQAAHAAANGARWHGWPRSPDDLPGLFAHWRLGARPDGWAMGAG